MKTQRRIWLTAVIVALMAASTVVPVVLAFPPVYSCPKPPVSHFSVMQPSSIVPGDPNRNPCWDWTADVEYRLYISHLDDVTVRLPYFEDMGPAAADLNTGGAERDIDPGGGWVLVARNFGTETDEVRVPYFILYNKYRGILRYLFYHTSTEPFTYGLVKLEPQVPEKAAALFTFGEPAYFANAFDADLSPEVVVRLGFGQWCYADFVILGYDPTPPTDATLLFTLFGVEETQLQASVDYTFSEVEGRAHITGKRDSADAFATAYKKYKSADAALADLKKALGKKEDEKDEKEENFYAEYLGPILDSPFADAVPYLSAAAGFIKALLGGKPGQPIPMKFEGGAELSGTLTTPYDLHTLLLRMPGAPLSDPDDTTRPLPPLYTQPLGIFNLVDQPVMLRQVEMTCRRDKVTWEWVCSEEVDHSFQNAPHVVINPALTDAAVEVRAGLIFPNQAVTYDSLSDFRWLTLHESLDEGEQPMYSEFNMALEVTVMPHNGSYYYDPIVITNTYEIAETTVFID